MATWIRSKFPGVYYREHPTRKNGPHFDRYLTIRYTSPSGRHQEGLGWVSEGWTLEQASALLGKIKQNIRLGQGDTTFKDLRDHKHERESGEATAAALRELTFGAVAERYLAWAQTAKSSWKSDQGRYERHLRGPLGALPLSRITTTTLVNLKTALEQHVSICTHRKLAPATVVQCLSLVRQIFNFASNTPLDPTQPERAMFQGLNPARLTRRKGYGVRMPIVDNARLRVLTPDEVSKLLDAALPDHPLHHDIILVAYDCGLRVGELLRLTAQNVMGNGESLHVVDTKSGKNRIVFPRLSKEVLLRRAAAATPERPYLFPGAGNGPRSNNAFQEVFQRIVDRVGLNDGVTDRRFKVTPHTLRHTYATLLYMETHDLYLVLRRLGHSDFSVTMRYVHLAEELAARMGVTAPAPPQR